MERLDASNSSHLSLYRCLADPLGIRNLTYPRSSLLIHRGLRSHNLLPSNRRLLSQPPGPCSHQTEPLRLHSRLYDENRLYILSFRTIGIILVRCDLLYPSHPEIPQQPARTTNPKSDTLRLSRHYYHSKSLRPELNFYPSKVHFQNRLGHTSTPRPNPSRSSHRLPRHDRRHILSSILNSDPTTTLNPIHH